MAKRRTTPELNLQKELPQVLSTDFNLFYKPDVAPVDTSVEVFTKSLDAFVSGAGTDLVIAGEIKQKKENEAQAIKDYNENRDKFTKQVENGSIPKEANPYYIEKLQELHLNRKAFLSITIFFLFLIITPSFSCSKTFLLIVSFGRSNFSQSSEILNFSICKYDLE